MQIRKRFIQPFLKSGLSLKKAGFTLIELIMTILLIAVVVIPSSLFLIEAVNGAFKSEDITVAMNLAQMEIEKTNNILYTNLPDGVIEYSGASKAEYQPYKYDLRRTITYIYGDVNSAESVKEIKVEIYPQGRLGNSQYLLTTVITHRARNVN